MRRAMYSFVLGQHLSLQQVAASFGLAVERDLAMVSLRRELSAVLFNPPEDGAAFFYPDGVGVFFNLTMGEISGIIEFLRRNGLAELSVLQPEFMDECLVQLADDAVTPEVTERGRVILPASAMEYYVPVLAAVLAQSLLIHRGEVTAEEYHEAGEGLLSRLAKTRRVWGKADLVRRGRLLRMLLATQLHFSLRCLPRLLRGQPELGEFYRQLEEKYSLNQRIAIIREKNRNLLAISSQCHATVMRKEEGKVYWIETLLIGSFLVMDIIYYFG